MALATADAVVLELMTMGQQSAAHLGDLLRASTPASSSPPGELHQQLATEVLRCCDRVIAALRASSSSTGAARTQKRKTAEHEVAAPASSPPAPPPSKRRPRGAGAVSVVKSSTTVDGFIWRKYGQKDINGHRHPRLYYRCAYKHQGCAATRRVQRTRDEPAPAYEIAYYGEHTCRAACQAEPAPPAVVNFGSNAWAALTASEQQQQQGWSWDGGEASASQGGWSSSAASSEAEFVAPQAHGWPSDVAGIEEPSAAAPWDDASPVMGFLDGCFGWESIISDPFDFGGDLHHAATLHQ